MAEYEDLIKHMEKQQATIDALLKQLNAQKQPAHPQVILETYNKNDVSRHYTSSYMSKAVSVLKQYGITEEKQMVRQIYNQLPLTVTRDLDNHLLPTNIDDINTTDELQKALVKLYEPAVSTFRCRVEALSMKWYGPKHQSIAELWSRARSIVNDCDVENLDKNAFVSLAVLLAIQNQPELEGYKRIIYDMTNINSKISNAEVEERMKAAEAMHGDIKMDLSNQIDIHQVRSNENNTNSRSGKKPKKKPSRPCKHCGGSLYIRHTNQMRIRRMTPIQDYFPYSSVKPSEPSNNPDENESTQADVTLTVPSEAAEPNHDDDTTVNVQEPETVLRRSDRVRREPDRYRPENHA